jgi:hypothetical protein
MQLQICYWKLRQNSVQVYARRYLQIKHKLLATMNTLPACSEMNVLCDFPGSYPIDITRRRIGTYQEFMRLDGCMHWNSMTHRVALSLISLRNTVICYETASQALSIAKLLAATINQIEKFTSNERRNTRTNKENEGRCCFVYKHIFDFSIICVNIRC